MNVPSRQADHGERHGATVLLRTSRPRQGRALRVGIHDQGPPPPGQSCRQKEARQRLAAAALEVHHRDLHRPPSAGFVLTSVRKFSSVYVCTDIRMYGHTYVSTSVSQYSALSAPCAVWRPCHRLSFLHHAGWLRISCATVSRAGSRARDVRPSEGFLERRAPRAGAKKKEPRGGEDRGNAGP